MQPIGWHVILRLEDDRVIAPSAADRRAAAAAVAAIGEAFGVYAWSIADNHLHLALFASYEQAAELARRLRVALCRRLRLDVRFLPTRIRPIADQAHARSLLFYCLKQAKHHGALQDRWHEANCIHDLLSTRLGAPWLPRRVQEHLPRVSRRDLLDALGLPDFAEAGGVDVDAVAAAFLLPSVVGNGRPIVLARRAAIAAAPDAVAELAAALGVDERSVRRLRSQPPPPLHLRALRRQLGLRAVLALQPGGLADVEAWVS